MRVAKGCERGVRKKGRKENYENEVEADGVGYRNEWIVMEKSKDLIKWKI